MVNLRPQTIGTVIHFNLYWLGLKAAPYTKKIKKYLQLSLKALVVKTSLNCITLECWSFFHRSTSWVTLTLLSR